MIGIVVVYMIVSVAVGLWAARRAASSRDFYVSDRSVGPWVVAFSTTATTASGFFFLGLPGQAYTIGYQALIALPVNAMLAFVVAYALLAKPMRYVSEKFNAMTVPDIFRVAYHSKAVGMVATLFILIGTFTYLVSQWVGAGIMFQTLLGTTYGIGLLVGVIIIGFYCSMGGQLANLYNDAIQMVVMMIGSVLAVVIGMKQVGGFTEMNRTLTQVNPEMMQPFSNTFGLSIFMFLSWWLIYAVGYVGQPQVVTRFMTIKKAGMLRWAPAISAVSYFFITFILFVGMIYRAGVAKGMVPAAANTDAVVPAFLTSMAPSWFGGVLMAAALAAIMSTVSTFLIVAASALIRDLFEQGLGVQLDEKKGLVYARFGTIILAAVSVVLAIKPPTAIAFLGNIAFGFFAAALGPALVAAFRWRRATWQGALASMIVGGGLSFVLSWLKTAKIYIPQWDPGAIGMAASLVALVVVSLATPKQERQVLPKRVQAESAAD